MHLWVKKSDLVEGNDGRRTSVGMGWKRTDVWLAEMDEEQLLGRESKERARGRFPTSTLYLHLELSGDKVWRLAMLRRWQRIHRLVHKL
jgi:hypothetical protein